MEKENNMKLGILIVAMMGIVLLASGCTNNNNTTNDNSKNIENEHSSLNFEMQSSESVVAIDLTPKEFENGKLYVDISVNTHSIDLTQFDLTKLVKLEYASNSIFPESAPKLSGHHTSGTLIFDTGKELKSFKIIVKGIPDIKERIFEWS